MNYQLHHIGILVKNIPEAADRYVRRFGYEIASKEIEDPVQTAIVMFLHHKQTNAWIELITPNGENSKLTNALKKGERQHHLCYEVDDIHEACAALRNDQMFILSMPVPATAFPHRKIAWLMEKSGMLVELLEKGPGPLSLDSLTHINT